MLCATTTTTFLAFVCHEGLACHEVACDACKSRLIASALHDTYAKNATDRHFLHFLLILLSKNENVGCSKASLR